MIDKRVASVVEALSGLKSGSTILLGGFGSVGQPDAITEALIEHGADELTVVANNAGSEPGVGLSKVLAAGIVRKMICSFPRSRGSEDFERLYAENRIELELVPQGTLAERLRAGGAGIPAFYTRTSVDTLLAQGKEHRMFDGVTYVLETALRGDFALIEAWRADRWGNLHYRGSGRNFNPIMATAAMCTVAQVRDYTGGQPVPPEEVMTPGLYVDRVIDVADIERGRPRHRPEETVP